MKIICLRNIKFCIHYKLINKILNKYMYFIKGSLLLGTTQILSILISFIGVFIFTRFGSKILYGSYAFINSFGMLANGFVAPGIMSAVTYSVAKGGEGVLWQGTKIRLKRSWFAMLFLICIGVYELLYAKRSELFYAFLIQAIFFPFVYCTDLFNAFLQGKKEFKVYSILYFFSTLTGSIGVSCAVIFTKSLVLIIFWSALLTSLFNIITMRYVLKNFVTNNTVVDEFKILSKRWTWLSIMGTAASQVDRIVIGSFTNMSTLGAYNLAKSIANPLRNIGVVFNKLIFPKIGAKRYFEALNWMYNKLKLLVLFFIMSIIFTWFIAPTIINVFFHSYYESIGMLRILGIINCGLIINIIVSTLFTSQLELHSLYFKLNYIATTLQIVLILSLGLKWEVKGILIGMLIFTIVSIIFNICLVIYLKQMKRFVKECNQ